MQLELEAAALAPRLDESQAKVADLNRLLVEAEAQLVACRQKLELSAVQSQAELQLQGQKMEARLQQVVRRDPIHHHACVGIRMCGA